MPYSLNLSTLHASWQNKFGHTRESGDVVNHHADHHLLHSKNFGREWGVPLEMILGTNSNCDTFELCTHRCLKSESAEYISVECIPTHQ